MNLQEKTISTHMCKVKAKNKNQTLFIFKREKSSYKKFRKQFLKQLLYKFILKCYFVVNCTPQKTEFLSIPKSGKHPISLPLKKNY